MSGGDFKIGREMNDQFSGAGGVNHDQKEKYREPHLRNSTAFAGRAAMICRAMRINVKLFTILRDRAGTGEMSLDVTPRATVESAIAMIAQSHPSLGELLPRVAVAVNREYVAVDYVLHDGDELALIPPVSGG